MVQQAQGAGHCGFAFESTIGTYVAPTKFVPIMDESIERREDKYYRNSIRGVVEKWGAHAGPKWIEGDIKFEVIHDIMPYFLYAGRFTVTKSGTDPYTYVAVPSTVAKGATAGPGKPLSITIKRGDQYFYYTGCNVTQYEFSIEDGILTCNASIIGLDEDASASDTTAVTMPSGSPYTMDKHTLTFGGSGRSDIADLSFTVNDSGNPEHRPGITSAKPSFVSFGEREVTFSGTFDFDTATDYNNYVANTTQAVVLLSEINASSDSFKIDYKSAVMDSYKTNLSSLGDLTTAEVEMMGLYDASSSKSLEITVKTTENIT